MTKGDVLLAVGKIKNAYGSAEKLNLDIMGPSGKRKSEVSALRSLPEVLYEADGTLGVSNIEWIGRSSSEEGGTSGWARFEEVDPGRVVESHPAEQANHFAWCVTTLEGRAKLMGE